MNLSITILGCGSSGGVPRIGNEWGSCDPMEPRNHRRRCSVLVERQQEGKATRVLIDTSPDLRIQALDAGLSSLDGVWFTHEHADHTHGIDELRGFFLKQRKRVPIWADEPTMAMLHKRFAYCFATQPGSEYPAILDPHLLRPAQAIETGGPAGPLTAMPFTVNHGNINALGFRIAGVAYTPDLNGIPDESLPFLQNLDLWIVDALKHSPHPSHLHLAETLRWIERLKPARAILTNMHNDMDYRSLQQQLPAHVAPAYDGMTIALEG